MKGRSRADLLNAARSSGKRHESCQKKKLISFPALAPCKQRLSAPGSGGMRWGMRWARLRRGESRDKTLFPVTRHLRAGRLGAMGCAEIPPDFGRGLAELEGPCWGRGEGGPSL